MTLLPPTLGHNSRAAEIQSKAKLTIMMLFLAGSGTVGSDEKRNELPLLALAEWVRKRP